MGIRRIGALAGLMRKLQQFSGVMAISPFRNYRISVAKLVPGV